MVKIPRSEFERALKLIRESEEIWNLTHENPDGDAIGSAIAFHYALKKLGKNVHTYLHEPVPRMYAGICGVECIEVVSNLPAQPPNLIIACDNATFKRFGKAYSNDLGRLGIFPAYEGRHSASGTRIINIDHHKDNEHYGDLNIVLPEVSAVAEISLQMIKELIQPVPTVCAKSLYAGLITDTGRFSYSNTNLSTIESALELVRLGVEPSEIVRDLYYTLGEEDLKLLGRVLENLRVEQELGFYYSYIDLKMLKTCGVELGDSEWVMDVLKLLKTPNVCVLFKQYEEDFIRVSVRSREGFDSAMLARKFGGGGHVSASGYTFNGELNDAITALRQAMIELRTEECTKTEESNPGRAQT